MPLSPREGQSLTEGRWLCSSAMGSVQLSHLHLSGSCLEALGPPSTQLFMKIVDNYFFKTLFIRV